MERTNAREQARREGRRPTSATSSRTLHPVTCRIRPILTPQIKKTLLDLCVVTGTESLQHSCTISAILRCNTHRDLGESHATRVNAAVAESRSKATLLVSLLSALLNLLSWEGNHV